MAPRGHPPRLEEATVDDDAILADDTISIDADDGGTVLTYEVN